ncbi:MAG: calcium/sodium antiporter [Myxococcota bacterium]|nr:calcium/sodium antiporter [Myxococcota bacterium]
MEGTPIAIASLLGGLVMLLWGANVMVEHSVRLGRRIGMSALVIGSTIIALGTSAPEFVVSFMAGLQGSPGIAVGNVLGSNISNLGLVLGVGILLTPFAVERRVIRIEYLVTLVVTVLATLFLWTHDGLAQWEGWCLAGLMVVLFGTYLTAELKKGDAGEEDEGPRERLTFGQSLRFRNLKESLFGEASELPAWEHGLFAVGGLALLVVGSQFAVDGAKFICSQFGVSEAVVGATVVALGTSLPELATVVAAARRGDGGGSLILGNVLGSNIFNILFVLGATGSVVALPVSPIERSLMLPLVAGITLVPGFFFVAQGRASRGLGWVLMGSYVAFIALSTLEAVAGASG